MADKFYVTQEGLDELKAEHEHLIHVVRQEVIVELQEARAQGDLSENADYDAARDHQARVEARILELESLIKNSEIIKEETSGTQTVRLGTTVTVKDLSDGSLSTYSIVGTIEADPFNGKISNDSPFAKAILDKKAGDTVTIKQAAEPYDVEIIEVH
jgi:transcription elongation factor GreA